MQNRRAAARIAVLIVALTTGQSAVKAHQAGGPLNAVIGSIDLSAVIIGAVVLVLLAIVAFFFGRLRARFAPTPQPQPSNARSGVWNG